MGRSLADIDPEDPDVGGKAAGLARLLRAGVAVPPGIVLRPGESVDEREARALGPHLIVRSSATCEDRAPGVFLSCRDVSPGEPLARAIDRVRASLDELPARAYLERRGIDRSTVRMAVIVQRQIDGERGTLYTREPGDPTSAHAIVETASSIAPIERATLRPLVETELDLARIARAALEAEAAIGAPADVEWVLGGDAVWIVQARPIAFAPRDPRDDEFGAALAFSRADPSALWIWDGVHNPDPLSAAQAGLVELVEAEGASPRRQHVARGFLYVESGSSLPGEIEPSELPRVWRDEIRPSLVAALARMDADPTNLESVLAAYVELYAIYARRLAPAVAEAKRALARAGGDRALSGAPVAPLPEYLDVAPTWDVASPSYGESPELWTALAPPTPGTDAPDALRIGDEDDLLFARAQAAVRRALAATAARLGVSLEDLLNTPLAETRAAARAGAAPRELPARARAAALERERWRGFLPPSFVVDGRPIRGARAPNVPGLWHGRGSGGRARGRVARLFGDGPWAPPARGAVLVVATVLPQHAPLLTTAAAVVSEQGGLLGHGAALARELGIPCVVGASGVRAALRDGDEVYVDAESGLVIRL